MSVSWPKAESARQAGKEYEVKVPHGSARAALLLGETYDSHLSAASVQAVRM
jgi:hypothetical protein